MGLSDLSEVESKVLNQLQGVVDPELGSDIVDLGMVKGVDHHDDGHVLVTVALTTSGCPLRAQIQRDIRSKLSHIPEVTKVKINWTELTQDEKSEVMARARLNISQEETVTQIPRTAKSIMVASGKGGVGKSSVSANIASGIAHRGYTVGVLDADIWGFSIPQMLGLSGRLEGNEETRRIKPIEKQAGSGVLKIVSMGFLITEESSSLNWRGLILNRAVRHFLEDVEWGHLDYLIIDMPPGTGDVQLTLCQKAEVSGALIVSTPQDVALIDARKAIDMFRTLNTPILGLIENMSNYQCPKCGHEVAIFGHGGVVKESENLGLPFLGEIPLDLEIRLSGDAGCPVSTSEKPISEAFNNLAEVVIKQLSHIEK